MRMRKKKWVSPFLETDDKYLIKDFSNLDLSMPIHIEIGMGMGDFICASAIQNKNINYIGLEKVDVCVARAIKKAKENDIDNLKIMLEDAENINEVLPQNSVDVIYLHFSDPWPKKRQHKRRLTYISYLKKYEYILKKGGFLIFKTDNEDFYNDSLLYFEESNFKLVECDRNYINDNEPKTAYQEKFMALGKPIYYAKYSLI